MKGEKNTMQQANKNNILGTSNKVTKSDRNYVIGCDNKVNWYDYFTIRFMLH